MVRGRNGVSEEGLHLHQQARGGKEEEISRKGLVVQDLAWVLPPEWGCFQRALPQVQLLLSSQAEAWLELYRNPDASPQVSWHTYRNICCVVENGKISYQAGSSSNIGSSGSSGDPISEKRETGKATVVDRRALNQPLLLLVSAGRGSASLGSAFLIDARVPICRALRGVEGRGGEGRGLVVPLCLSYVSDYFLSPARHGSSFELPLSSHAPHVRFLFHVCFHA